MKFIIDNALSPSIANGLKEAGHNAIHVRDIGMASASDREILLYAKIENRVVVSADTDFGTILALNNDAKPSFLLLRRSDKKPLSQLNMLINIIESLQEDLEKGAVVVIEDKRIRIRELPINKD